jgi:hypothetical protein
MDEVQIERVETEIPQRPLDGGANVLGAVIRVPQLRRDPQVASLADSVAENSTQPFADFCFVAVIARAVEVAVTGTGGFDDDVGSGRAIDFPETESYGRQRSTAVERQVLHEANVDLPVAAARRALKMPIP